MKNYRIQDIRQTLQNRCMLYPLDVALVGATGVGKSSTLNALFGEAVAKVGTGVAPETQVVSEYRVNDVFRVHDSAGFGDGLAADVKHATHLSDLLLKSFVQIDAQRNGFVDLALVILDGSSRDLGTTFKLLEQVVLSCIEPERVIVAINQADMAMKGRFWNDHTKQPEMELLTFLQEKAQSTQQRIKQSTGLQISQPVFYSASQNYNIDVLCNHIIAHIPRGRRLV